MNNDQIFDKIWGAKKLGETIDDIHSFCGRMADAIIKYSMEKDSVDNVSVIFIAFKNFEDKMKDPNFEYTAFPKVKIIKEKYDFGLISK